VDGPFGLVGTGTQGSASVSANACVEQGAGVDPTLFSTCVSTATINGLGGTRSGTTTSLGSGSSSSNPFTLGFAANSFAGSQTPFGVFQEFTIISTGVGSTTGSFNVNTPEPGSAGLVGLGALLLGAGFLKRKWSGIPFKRKLAVAELESHSNPQ